MLYPDGSVRVADGPARWRCFIGNLTGSGPEICRGVPAGGGVSRSG